MTDNVERSQLHSCSPKTVKTMNSGTSNAPANIVEYQVIIHLLCDFAAFENMLNLHALLCVSFHNKVPRALK